MLYIVRLTNGDCVVAMAADEGGARHIASKLNLDEAAEVATIRQLDTLGIQFSPTEDGSLEVTHWDDATLDNILAHEYPLLNQACQRANAEPFLPASNPHDSAVSQLRAAYERNTDIIRQGLRQELQRSTRSQDSTKTNAASGHK